MQHPIRVGLIGAGPWARMVHAPAIAASQEFALSGVWSRNPVNAESLARREGVPPFTDLSALLEVSDAVVCAVPPTVQPSLAIRAARAGKPVLLEKPIAVDVQAADELAGAIAEAGVASLVALTWRFAPAVRQFLTSVASCQPFAGRATFISGGLLGGPFATPWRLEHGALLDLGPHVLDILDATLGPVARIRAHGDAKRWVGLLLDHESGAVSEASISGVTPVRPALASVEVYGHEGHMAVDCMAAVQPATFATMYSEFARAIRGDECSTPDVQRGLGIQRLLAEAELALRS